MRAARNPMKYDALESRYVGVDASERPQTLKLFSDSCPGQNKNTAMIFMLLGYVQQNQPLSKLSISDGYYLRQICLYNLTFVILEGSQHKQNTFAYTWTENESSKESNEV
ncbi:hypothetical protein QE152_g24407 [Popillia japonica]|uniref:Uncharacterized protein n=1 Tax=Popillia japonica TaxID=7064 RepID=A0AAW1KBN8_POPJA